MRIFFTYKGRLDSSLILLKIKLGLCRLIHELTLVQSLSQEMIIVEL